MNGITPPLWLTDSGTGGRLWRTTVREVVSAQHDGAVPRRGSRYHGDRAADPGMLDFAVNVRHRQPPDWLLARLAARLPDLAGYPSVADQQAAVRSVARRHGVPEDHVLLLAGGSEGFALLPALRPRLVALIVPSYTEPEAVLTAAGVALHQVPLTPPFRLTDAISARIPGAADMVVLGNPTNPTGVLHSRESILALRRDGRLVVIDEAFADAVPGEPESVASVGAPDVLVLRSLTKTWALAGLRAGYALGAPEVLARLSAARPHWPLGTLQLEAIAACCEPGAVSAAEADARRLAVLRHEMAGALAGLGLEVIGCSAPFIAFAVPDAVLMRKHLRTRGIAVRRCDTFVGMGTNHLRVAVRAEWPALVSALAEVLR